MDGFRCRGCEQIEQYRASLDGSAGRGVHVVLKRNPEGEVNRG